MRTSFYPMALGLSALMCVGAFAAGESGSNEPSPTLNKCQKGEVWDEATKSCKKAQFGAVDDNSLLSAGRDLAYAERPEEAITVLKLARNQQDHRILNYLGYSHRKLGRMDEALGYYHAAIEAKPEYTLVREYLGEAYLQLGDLLAAKGQLEAIKRYCGQSQCLEYKDLAEEIAEYERQKS